MGDIGSGDASGAVMAERPACDNPDPASISKENWTVAEGITWEVVNDVHPTLDSEERRNNVIDYVQRLLKSSLGFEVFGFGSVPLKTYLPDGDIDLTILSSSGAEASWAADVLSVLQREEKNECAEFQVKDTQFIDAEVKLVKCLVQNMVIDISFNQFGGLCTLCFLEQVDRLVGNHHLFKRSIILIKAWCYYESRILGAHHGLLSTYALETLVLYIFHLFHSSLDGPLAVLYQFLDYFSKFDWENYCISLKGPVCKSSLPEIVAQMPVKEGNRLMLSEEFLRNCMEMFSMPSLGPETNSRVFSPKHLNIIDPLKEYNNLGRSVHRGNFFRIRSAFRYGARKLGRVLSLPEDKIADEIKNFFCNTLRRHESKFGSSTPDYASVLNGRGPVTFLSSSQPAVLYEDRMHLISSGTDSDNDGHFMEERQNSIHSAIYSWRVASSPTMPGLNHSVESLSGYHLNGDACDFVRHNYVDFRTSNSTSDCSPSSNPSVASLGQFCHVPLLFLPNSSPRNGYPSQVNTCDGIEERLGPETWPEHRDENMEMANIFQSCSDSLDGYSSCYSAVSSPKSNISESLSLDFREGDLLSADDTEPLNPLADLRGDYDSHIRSLLHGPFFHKLALLEHVLQHPPLSPSLSHFQIKNPWHTAHPSMSLEQHSFSQTNWSNISVSQPASSLAPCISAFASEENQKARGGTGTYFPVMNNYCQDGPSQGWNSRPLSSGMHGQSPRHNTHGNGYNPTYSEMPNSAKGGREVAQAWCPVQDKKKSGSSSQSECSQECRNCADGFSNSSQRIEFGSIGHLVDEVISASRSSCALASNNHHLKASSGFEKAEKKVADEPFGLKNEDEFPPLSI